MLTLAIVAGSYVALMAFSSPPTRAPTGQAELDLMRGGRVPVLYQFGVPRMIEKSREYYEARINVIDLAQACGKSVNNGLTIEVSHAFSGARAISVVDGERVQVDYPSELPPAYLGANKLITIEEEGVFNPAASKIAFDRKVSKLSWWQRQWLTWQIRRSGVLVLPYSVPSVDLVLDGSQANVDICDRGLHYGYTRSLDDGTLEQSLKRLLNVVGAI